MNIKAIFLDWGNVLVGWKDRVSVLEEIASAHGGDAKQLRAFLVGSHEYSAQQQNIRLFEVADTGMINGHELFETICREGKFCTQFETFVLMYNAYIRSIPESIALAQKLARRYPVVGVTNTDELGTRKVSEILAKVPFKGTVRSWEVGFRKPSDQIWRRACEIAEVEPHEAVLVDDVPEYVEVWKRFGGYGVCFNATTQSIEVLIQELHLFGVSTV